MADPGKVNNSSPLTGAGRRELPREERGLNPRSLRLCIARCGAASIQISLLRKSFPVNPFQGQTQRRPRPLILPPGPESRPTNPRPVLPSMGGRVLCWGLGGHPRREGEKERGLAVRPSNPGNALPIPCQCSGAHCKSALHPSPICVMELLKPRPPDAPAPACRGGSARCG